ncbi:TapY2 family type IVa secretion system protein [Shewanella livingstonensis]|jgi:hypothetical protein|uniref:Uncharacterized protein n=1 Tax=Shewanella livingstonensis TaxID=150120 RepID=A0A3G8LXT0_9GAMM|nr:TapY2 family type IVa secretion system protein [Shewanella livingstonensis]AZG74224.1 hypothetical protein EGC82_16580 [Shewanella livingstonensis]
MIKLIVLCLCLVSFGGISQTDEWQDYKCHITSSSIGERILFYRWKSNDVKRKEMKLSGTQFKDSITGNKYYIKEVSECLPLNGVFKLETAKNLDNQTLR